MYRDLRNDPRFRKIKKDVEQILNKRIEYLLDNIFEGYIIVLCTETMVQEELIKLSNLKVKPASYEGRSIKLHYKAENHILNFIEKNEDLQKFINLSEWLNIDIKRLVAFCIVKDRITDLTDIITFQIKGEEFNRENVRGVIKDLLPSIEQIFGNLNEETTDEFVEEILIKKMVQYTVKTGGSNKKINKKKRF